MKRSVTSDGIPYDYFVCSVCGEEVVDRSQLYDMAERYRTMKKHDVKLSKWGSSIGLRIPRALARKYHLDEESEVTIIAEENGMRVVRL